MRALWESWRKRLQWRRRADAVTKVVPKSSQGVLEIEGAHFVFGLDWRMLPPTRRLVRALAMARQERMLGYALSEMEDIVGYLDWPLPLRRPHYAAPLQLASRFSQGGLELFVFVLAQQQHAVIALQDSRPLPGYDALGDVQTARTMVEEFLAIQRGQPMRLVGNTSWLEGQEWVEPEDLFVDPVRSARVRSLRSSRAPLRAGAIVLAAGTTLWGGTWGMERWREHARMELHRSPAYQQKVYADGLAQAWAALPPASQQMLDRWQLVWASLPQVHQGWALTRVQCDLQLCKAEWVSLFGSQADFYSALPSGVRLSQGDASENQNAVRTLSTEHPLTQISSSALSLQALPTRAQARRELSDFLLDLKLLGQAAIRIDASRLLGGDQDPALLVDPVFVGQWSLQHGLWLLPALQLPDFVRVQTLTLELPARRRVSNESVQPDDADGTPAPKWLEPHFLLTGTYYAKQ